MDNDEKAAWLRAREGKVTASSVWKVLAKKKNGEPLQARIDYMHELVAERSESGSMRHFVSDAMQWGLDQECNAKRAYETATGNDVAEAGFYDHPRIDNFGATPDGLLAGGGLIETKCPTTTKFIKWVIADAVPDEHLPQLIAQCACTGRKWVDFVAYDPRVKKGPHLLIKRFEPTEKQVAEIEQAVEEFLNEVDQMFYQFTHKAA